MRILRILCQCLLPLKTSASKFFPESIMVGDGSKMDLFGGRTNKDVPVRKEFSSFQKTRGSIFKITFSNPPSPTFVFQFVKGRFRLRSVADVPATIRYVHTHRTFGPTDFSHFCNKSYFFLWKMKSQLRDQWLLTEPLLFLLPWRIATTMFSFLVKQTKVKISNCAKWCTEQNGSVAESLKVPYCQQSSLG